MKICWDTLEKVIFTKNKNWKYKTQTLYEKICKNCGEYYLGLKKSEFCSKSCSQTGNNNINRRKKITNEHKKRLSISHIGKKCSYKAKEKISNSNYKCGKDLCWYDTYASKINFVEEVRRALDNKNILEVKCKYCGKWFKPTRIQLNNRITSLNENDGRYFYCSEECILSCPIYNQRKFPVGFTGDQNSSREVQPELRKLVLERDNYTCQKCGLNSNEQCVELHCHHIDPVKNNPIESADMNNCITLCKDCHLEAHQKDGCKTGQLANC